MEINKTKVLSKVLVILLLAIMVSIIPVSSYATYTRGVEVDATVVKDFEIPGGSKAYYNPGTVWFYDHINLAPRHYDGTHMTFSCKIYSEDDQRHAVKIYFTVHALNTTFYVTLWSDERTYTITDMPLGSAGGSMVTIEYDALYVSDVEIGVDNYTYSWYQ